MSLVVLSINHNILKRTLYSVTNFLETGTLKTQILGKIVKILYFSEKGYPASPYKPFQIYFRTYLCW